MHLVHGEFVISRNRDLIKSAEQRQPTIIDYTCKRYFFLPSAASVIPSQEREINRICGKLRIRHAHLVGQHFSIK